MPRLAAITVRGLDEAQLQVLKEQARRQGISLNSLMLQRLSEQKPKSTTERREHHDLDGLCGTWSETDCDDFFKAIAPFEQLDPELWG